MTKNDILPRYTFGWKSALVMLAGMVVLTMAVAAINVVSMFGFHVNLQYSDFYMIMLNTAGLCGAILAFDYLSCRPETRLPLRFDFRLPGAVPCFFAFGMMLGMMLIAEFFTAHIPITGPVFGELYETFSQLMSRISTDIPTMVLMTVFLAPLLEEIIFRGILLKGLLNKGRQPWKAILLSALVFGLVHGNPWQFLGAVLLGCVLGYVYLITKSLLLPMLLHAFNNLCSCLLVILYKNESFAEAFHFSELTILIIGLVFFVISGYLFNRYFIDNQKNV